MTSSDAEITMVTEVSAIVSQSLATNDVEIPHSQYVSLLASMWDKPDDLDGDALLSMAQSLLASSGLADIKADCLTDHVRALREGSQAIRDKLARPYTDPDVRLIYNYDFEADDHMRLVGNLKEILELSKAGKRAPSLVLVVGERIGETNESKTYREVVNELTDIIDSEPRLDWAEDTLVWSLPNSNTTVTLLRGAGLQAMPDDEPSEENHGGQACERTKTAAQRLSDLIGSKRYVFHNNTCCTLWAALPDNTKAQCDAFTQTCTRFFKGREVHLGANASFHKAAYWTTLDRCGEHKIPFIELHPTTTLFKASKLSDIEGYTDNLTSRVPDPEPGRQKIRHSWSMLLQWATQITADITKVYGEEMVTLAKNDIQPHWTRIKGTSHPLPEWTDLSIIPEALARDEAKDTRLRYVDTIANVIDNPYDNSLGDTLAECLDGPQPPVKMLIPVRFETNSEGKVVSHRIDPDSKHFLNIGGNETAFLDWEREQLKWYLEHVQSRAKMSGKPLFPVVSKEMADEYYLVIALVDSAIERASKTPGYGKDEEVVTKEEIASFERAKENMTKGLMARVAKTVTEGDDSLMRE